MLLFHGENGILNKSTTAKNETNKQTATEIINLKITKAQIENYSQKQQMPTLKELSLILKEDEEIEYILESSKLASVEYGINSDNPSKIYIKLKEYPYEFEINSSLEIASIDGLVEQEKLEVSTVPTSEITYNTTYIDNSSDLTWVDIRKYGNIVMLNYSLKVKKDIPNSSTILFSGIPEALTDVNFLAISTYNDVFSIRSKIVGTDVQLFWAGKTISTQNNNNTLEGGVVYISNN